MSFPHEAILVFNFFSALVDAFPYHSRPSATRDMGKFEDSNCLIWKCYKVVKQTKVTTYFTVVEQNPGPFGQKFSKPLLEELNEALKVLSDED